MKNTTNLSFQFDPKSRWIWTKDVLPNSYVAALAEFDMPASPRNAAIGIFADAKYKLYINGRFVNAGPCPFRKPVIMVDEYDVAQYLKKGSNTILVLAHFIGSNTKYNIAEKPGILASLSAKAGGKTIKCSTGGNWKVAELKCWNSNSPRRNWAIEHMEDLDISHPSFSILAKFAAEDYAGGKTADTSSLWQAPHVFERKDLELRKRMVPALLWKREDVSMPLTVFRGNTEVYNLQDTAVRLDHEHVWRELDEASYEMTRSGHVTFERREGEPGFLMLYDFRRMCAGEPAIEITCENPCTLDFAMSEDLTPNGRPIIWRNSGLYYSRYHLVKGLNKIRFYHFNGHRYLYLSLKDAIGKVEIKNVTTHHCRADLDYQDNLSCEDREAESLYRICRRSVMLNTQALAYDCNTREQGAYWGDGVWVVDSVGHQTGDFSHMRHLCYAATEEFNATGPFIGASIYGMGQPLFDYCLVPPDCLWRYYRFTGDTAAVADNIHAIRGIVEEFRKLKTENGLLAKANIPKDARTQDGLLFLDHSGNGWHPMTTVGNDRRDFNAGFNLYYLQAIQALLELEKVLGGDTKNLSKEVEKLKKDILKVCFIPGKGMVADAYGPGISNPRFSQIVNSLAITTGLIDGETASNALSTVLDITRHPWVSQGTPYSYFFLAEAAAVSRLGDKAVRAFNNDFGDMLKRGATTPWEAWRSENHDSRNHAWSAPLPYLIRRAIIGLEPLKPGYAELKLAPDLQSFDTFEGTCMIPQGEIHAKWNRTGTESFDLSVKIPRGVSGTIQLGKKTIKVKNEWRGAVGCLEK
ncbi:MAG TPA: hypothetical protein DET40_09825 [Lentisphaeria bacterium]|nr:MAG: hypothetical protein A2X45_08610 [Lentisphaerae bacterium GWF2_50_93]HCE43833.1 hypothetical protein [Lentisphaeria bacterium]